MFFRNYSVCLCAGRGEVKAPTQHHLAAEDALRNMRNMENAHVSSAACVCVCLCCLCKPCKDTGAQERHREDNVFLLFSILYLRKSQHRLNKLTFLLYVFFFFNVTLFFVIFFHSSSSVVISTPLQSEMHFEFRYAEFVFTFVCWPFS